MYLPECIDVFVHNSRLGLPRPLPDLLMLFFTSAFVASLHHFSSRLCVFELIVFILRRSLSATRLADPRCLPGPNAGMRRGQVSLLITTATSEFLRRRSSSWPPYTYSQFRRFPLLFPASELQHLLLSTVTLITASTANPHTHARPDSHLAKTRLFDVRGYCNAVVWDERRGSNTRSHVVPITQTAAGGL